MDSKKVNHQEFTLVTKPNPSLDDYGWDNDYYNLLVELHKTGEPKDLLKDAQILNDLGIMFSESVCVECNIDCAIKYFTQACELGDDLAKSNLADIYRKGNYGAPVDLKKAFELYKSCRLPYAYYRVGEAYELGRGVAQNLEEAKQYYRVAYKEQHPLAIKKLQQFDFLK